MTGVQTCALPIYVSSSLIREKLIKGEEVRGMLPKKVYEYIMENGCYGLDKE